MNKAVVIVTGTSRGIGLATSQVLLKDLSACVVGVARKSNENVVALATEHPESFQLVLGDIVDAETSQRAVKTALDRWGHLDGLVLNAGILEPMGPVSSIPVDSPPDGKQSWRSHFDTNFFSLIYTIQAALPSLKGSQIGGRIVMVSSGAAVKGYYGWGPYAAGKAAMNSLVRTLATEEPDIVTLAIRPGVVNTDMQTQIRQTTTLREQDIVPFITLHTDGNLVSPEESGYVLGSAVLKAGKGLSGGFWSWDGAECKEFRRVRN